jgi:hypothetical protein
MLQRQLDIITEWTGENEMLIGINKCGHQVSEDSLFMLAGERVPYTATYKYLGFPHKRRGIDFQQHVQTMTVKARGVFDHCRMTGRGWPPGVRLVIVKSFIRPVLEYGFPLLAALHWAIEGERLGGRARRGVVERVELIERPGDLFQPARDLLDECLKWVVESASSGLHAAAVCGIPPMAVRAQGLGASFVHHMQSMAPDHPAHLTLQHYNRNRVWPTRAVLIRASKCPLYPVIVERHRANPERKFGSLIKAWYIEELEKRSTIARYISRSARRKGYGGDGCLFWDDDRIRDEALRWRVGAWGLNLPCPRGHRFTRACIMRCRIPVPAADGLRLSSRAPRNIPEHYSWVDMFLNNFQAGTFQGILGEVREHLMG